MLTWLKIVDISEILVQIWNFAKKTLNKWQEKMISLSVEISMPVIMSSYTHTRYIDKILLKQKTTFESLAITQL